MLTGEGYHTNNSLFPLADVVVNSVVNVSNEKYYEAAEQFGEGVAYYLGLPISGSKELFKLFGIDLKHGESEGKMNIDALWGRR